MAFAHLCPCSGALEAFLRGQAVRAQDYLGSHPACVGGKAGLPFRVWAPALGVSLIGAFNAWNETLCPSHRWAAA